MVSTPIGNLRDITLRALDVLASVDAIWAEDTRVTGKLLSAYGVSAKLRPYNDHNGAEARPRILADLLAGKRVALVSDAGTPLVSDPGFKLVREAVERGASVVAIPGASAPLAALAVAGLPTDRFLFSGFPPPRSAARLKVFAELKPIRTTLVFFEGPSRLVESLADMAATFGPRPAVVARELTKLFEEARRGTLTELAGHYAREGPPRGEIVILVGPPSGALEEDAGALDDAILAADSTRPLKEVSAEIAARLGLKRRDVYERALELRDASAPNEDGDGD
ncbi:MAG: 16S rRNA (cytidine(1402)-2'-O)-methyltransferase [Alphaproteobacteria bacterium]